MAQRQYANAPATTLASGINNSVVSMTVVSTTGHPVSFPYTVIVDRGTGSEEVMDVTGAAGTTLDISRGADSTTAFSHSAGATVEVGISARDPREANTHVNSSTGVHGLSGAVVGHTDTQTLTNKTISVASNTLSGMTASRFMVSNGSGNAASSLTKAIPGGDVVGTSDSQVLTNKDLTSGTNTFPSTIVTETSTDTLTNKTISADNNTLSGIAASSFVLSNGSGNIDGAAAQKVIPSGAVVGTTDSQTLTNKNLTDATNTFGVSALNFTGMIVPGGNSSPPTGWLLCDGAAVSRSTFAALFSAIGTAFGAGDGSTTFNTPDLRGRVPLGAGTALALGATSGQAAEANRLTAHGHTISGDTTTNGAHTHGAGSYSAAASGTAPVDRTQGATNTADDTHTHDVTGTSASNGDHNHSLPGLSTASSTVNAQGVNYFIKT